MMAAPGDIESKLRASKSIETLALEASITAELNELGWNASHGMFYLDILTGKSRELDVIAYQIWERDDGPHETSCTLRLLIECKSAIDFHIVFASTPQNMSRNILAGWWIGDRAVSITTFAALADAGIEPADLADLREYCDTLAHEGDSLDPLPLRTSQVGTTFRETNVGAEKDLDSSVLWRAILTLRSATEALRRRQTQTRTERLVRSALDERKATQPILDELQAMLASLMPHREYYHRIVVIESTLWTLSAGNLLRVPWCRFEQRDEWDTAHVGRCRHTIGVRRLRAEPYC